MAESGLILKAVLGNELCKILLGARGHKRGLTPQNRNSFFEKTLAGEMLTAILPSDLL